tara:strand:+ start:4164 stop:4625 length:462 start_codon:yes stop_codon:yes gene_type:complete
MKKIFILFFIILISFSNGKAELKKPNNTILPIQVVKIQLSSLMENNQPYKDSGIEQTWKFAHPNNKKYTGPLEKFKMMLKGNSYSMLLNHIDNQVKEVFISEEIATFEVIILDVKKKYYKFKWQVEKYSNEGPLKGCWLTTAVSQPIEMSSSI